MASLLSIVCVEPCEMLFKIDRAVLLNDCSLQEEVCKQLGARDVSISERFGEREKP